MKDFRRPSIKSVKLRTRSGRSPAPDRSFGRQARAGLIALSLARSLYGPPVPLDGGTDGQRRQKWAEYRYHRVSVAAVGRGARRLRLNKCPVRPRPSPANLADLAYGAVLHPLPQSLCRSQDLKHSKECALQRKYSSNKHNTKYFGNFLFYLLRIYDRFIACSDNRNGTRIDGHDCQTSLRN